MCQTFVTGSAQIWVSRERIAQLRCHTVWSQWKSVDTLFIEPCLVSAFELKATGLAKPADGKKYKGKLKLLESLETDRTAYLFCISHHKVHQLLTQGLKSLEAGSTRGIHVALSVWGEQSTSAMWRSPPTSGVQSNLSVALLLLSKFFRIFSHFQSQLQEHRWESRRGRIFQHREPNGSKPPALHISSQLPSTHFSLSILTIYLLTTNFYTSHYHCCHTTWQKMP